MGCSDSSSIKTKTEKIKKITAAQFFLLKKEKPQNEIFTTNQ